MKKYSVASPRNGRVGRWCGVTLSGGTSYSFGYKKKKALAVGGDGFSLS